MSSTVLDVENNEMVSEKAFLRNNSNIIIEYDGKKVGFNFKKYQKYVKKPDSDAVFVPCVFVDATEYNTERNFLKENESAIDAKLKELDTDNDEMLNEHEIIEFFKSFDLTGVDINIKDCQRVLKGLKTRGKSPFSEVRTFVDLFHKKKNFLKENESEIEEKMKELDTDNDQMLTEEEINKFFKSFDIFVINMVDKKECRPVLEGLDEFGKSHFSEVKKLFDSLEYRVNIVDEYNSGDEYNKIKKFENETEEDFKKKFEKYLSTSSFGFFKSNAMVLQDEIEKFYNKGKRYIVLKKTKNKMSFIGLNITLHNPDFYTNLQISELINEIGINDFSVDQEFKHPYKYTVFRSLKREFFTGPNDSGLKSITAYKGADYIGINEYLYAKFRDDKKFIKEMDNRGELKKNIEHIKNMDEVFINFAPRSKDVITVFRAGRPPESTHNPAFLSTTTHPAVITRGNFDSASMMEIKIRPGTPYLVLNIMNDEREILLPRGVFFKKLGQRKKIITDSYISSDMFEITEYEAYIPKYDPNDPVNIKMETPHYNKYYDEVCKDFHVLEVDVDITNEKSPKKEKRKSIKKSKGSTKGSSKGSTKGSSKGSTKGSRKKQNK